jgi:hypothetical protein
MIFKFKLPKTGNTEMQNFNQGLNSRSLIKRLSTSFIALALTAFQIVPAFATINNTVTANGTGPGSVPVTSRRRRKRQR